MKDLRVYYRSSVTLATSNTTEKSIKKFSELHRFTTCSCTSSNSFSSASLTKSCCAASMPFCIASAICSRYYWQSYKLNTFIRNKIPWWWITADCIFFATSKFDDLKACKNGFKCETISKPTLLELSSSVAALQTKSSTASTEDDEGTYKTTAQNN